MKKLLAASVAAATLGLAAPAVAQSGTLVLYTSQPDALLAEMIAVFNESYPDIEVETFRSGTTEVINRLQAEFAAGDPQPDVLLVANSIVMSRLAADGRLMAYEDAPVEPYDPAFYDPDMMHFGTKLITTGIIYNTELVDEAPTSWQDLAADAAAGQVIMPSPLYSGAAAYHVGTLTALDGFGWDYYEALAGNDAIAGRGNGSVREAVSTGQNAYGVIIDFMTFNARAAGSPVDFVFPAEGVTAITEPVAILSTARNVEAAQAFVDWLLSVEGQEFAAAQGYLPAHPDVPGPEAFPPLSEITVLSVDPAVLLENDEAMKRQFADLFGG